MKLTRLFNHLSFVVLVVAAARSTPAAEPTLDVPRAEQIVQNYVARNDFIGSVLVARGDEVLFDRSYGMANLDWNQPNAPDTRFRLGSITKQFTAVAILLLHERGMLSVEDPLSQHLADAPAAWKDITIHHLLTHTAGVPNFTALPEYRTASLQLTTPEQLLQLFRDKPLDFAAGEKFSYSNSGYVLLGYVIEKVSGQSYASFLQQNLFTPLQMQDSGYDSNLVILPRRATGYTHRGAEFAVASYVDMTVPFSAGALYSTTGDLLRWERALFGGKVLKPESLAKMTTPFKDNYAYGVIVTGEGNARMVSHNGAINGFNTAMAYYPASQTTIIALANVSGGAPDAIVAQLGQLAQGQAVTLSSERQEITLPAETLTRYVGTYQLNPQVTMRITLENGQLQTQLSGQAKLPVFAELETRFFLKVVDAQLEFKLDAANAVTAVVLHQGGRDTEAKRISDTVAERKEVTLPAEVLASYTGTYAGSPLSFTITLEDGHLMMLPSGQRQIELFAEAEDKFFVKVVDATVEFVREDGKVKALILHQGPGNLRAERQ